MKQVLILLSCIFFIGMALVYIFQRHLIYVPDKRRPSLSAFHASDMQVVTFKATDNLSINSWYKPATNHQPTILLLHGNAGHIGNRMPLVRHFLNTGFGVLVLEYRGYGGNPGTPTEQGLYADAQGALRFLNEQGVTTQHVVLYGESLGTAVATYLASENKVCCVILQSPYTSMSSLARYHYPWLLLRPKDKFDSLERIDKNYAPLLIIHGTEDKLVPFREGRRLFQQANQPKIFLKLENKAHNNLWGLHFYQEVILFIEEHCLNP